MTLISFGARTVTLEKTATHGIINLAGGRRGTIVHDVFACHTRRTEGGARLILSEVIVFGDASVSGASNEGPNVHTPNEIAQRLGRITVKTLTALIRARGLETTTLGYAEPSRKGGPRRREWGMTDAQLEVLLALRRRRGRIQDPS